MFSQVFTHHLEIVTLNSCVCRVSVYVMQPSHPSVGHGIWMLRWTEKLSVLRLCTTTSFKAAVLVPQCFYFVLILTNSGYLYCIDVLFFFL